MSDGVLERIATALEVIAATVRNKDADEDEPEEEAPPKAKAKAKAPAKRKARSKVEDDEEHEEEEEDEEDTEEEEEEEEEEITRVHVRKALTKLRDAEGDDAVRAVLTKLKVASVGKIAEKDFARAIKYASA